MPSTVARAAAAYSVRNRRRKADWLTTWVTERGVQTALVVGAESADFAWSNIVERALLHAVADVIVSGLERGLSLDGARLVRCDGRRLPFRDSAFDLVVSNAVIEHVGAEVDQVRFVDELHRVGRALYVTTPNRWFPVESHTRVLLRHWSPSWRAQHPREFTRLLSRQELRALAPRGAQVVGQPWSPTLALIHECSGCCSS